MTDYAAAARESGFTLAAPLDVATLRFLPEIRAMCSADSCRSYGRNWSCPPACGTLESFREACSRYRSGLLLQTVGEREDSFDIDAMLATEALHKAHIGALVDSLREAGEDFLLLASGTCTRCAACTYPDAPCRFPERLFPSMEACGLSVSQVCKDNGVPYHYGGTKIAYTACVLFDLQ